MSNGVWSDFSHVGAYGIGIPYVERGLGPNGFVAMGLHLRGQPAADEAARSGHKYAHSRCVCYLVQLRPPYSVEVGIDHHLNQILEADLRSPPQLVPGAAGIAE